MGRPSRCPGCKELKSAHDFGRPGKNCTGPVRNDTQQDLDAVDELEHTEEVGAPASTKPDVLQSLTESVQLLSIETEIASTGNYRVAYVSTSSHFTTTESPNSTAPCYITRTACYDRFGPDGGSTGRPTWRCLF